MEIVILGSGNPLPDAHRAGPSTLVRAAGQVFLFDCGRGVLLRAAAVGVMPGALTSLLLTHLHSDHITDLNDVVTTRWVTSFQSSPLPIIGPVGTRHLADATIDMLAADIDYRLNHHEDLTWGPGVDVAEVEPGIVYDHAGVKIIAAATDHKPVHPTLGYRIEAEGKSVVIAGDTKPCPGLDELCTGADVYVQTVVRRSLVELVPMQRFVDILDYHSDLTDAANTASKAGVRTLVLNHPVPTPVPGTEDEWIAEAAADFDGEILLAHDLLTVTA